MQHFANLISNEQNQLKMKPFGFFTMAFAFDTRHLPWMPDIVSLGIRTWTCTEGTASA